MKKKEKKKKKKERRAGRIKRAVSVWPAGLSERRIAGFFSVFFACGEVEEGSVVIVSGLVQAVYPSRPFVCAREASG